MTRKTGIIGFVLLAFIVYAVYRLNEARPTDWTQHFAPDSESPYGTRILTDALPILFPKADIVFPCHKCFCNLLSISKIVYSAFLCSFKYLNLKFPYFPILKFFIFLGAIKFGI